MSCNSQRGSTPTHHKHVFGDGAPVPSKTPQHTVQLICEYFPAWGIVRLVCPFGTSANQVPSPAGGNIQLFLLEAQNLIKTAHCQSCSVQFTSLFPSFIIHKYRETTTQIEAGIDCQWFSCERSAADIADKCCPHKNICYLCLIIIMYCYTLYSVCSQTDCCPAMQSDPTIDSGHLEPIQRPWQID